MLSKEFLGSTDMEVSIGLHFFMGLPPNVVQVIKPSIETYGDKMGPSIFQRKRPDEHLWSLWVDEHLIASYLRVLE